MNWRFWNRSEKSGDDCTAMEPLLSLYSDGMASAAEARRIEAHLKDCPVCQQSLGWMQATHQIIAARPAVPPPADLRARIARALAESEGVKAPVVKSPARRPQTLRPAFAYGLSVALFAAISGGLFWSAQQTHHNNVVMTPPPSRVAVVPQTPPPVTEHPPIKHILPHVHRPSPLVAARPDVTPPAGHRSIVRATPPLERVADSHTSDNGAGRNTEAPVVNHDKKPVFLTVPRPKLVIQKPTTDVNKLAQLPKNRDSMPAPKSPLHSAPPRDNVTANRDIPPALPTPETPPAPHIVIHPAFVTPDAPPEVHEASTVDNLRGYVQQMHRMEVSVHSVALTSREVVAAGVSSDRSATEQIVGTGFGH